MLRERRLAGAVPADDARRTRRAPIVDARRRRAPARRRDSDGDAVLDSTSGAARSAARRPSPAAARQRARPHAAAPPPRRRRAADRRARAPRTRARRPAGARRTASQRATSAEHGRGRARARRTRPSLQQDQRRRRRAAAAASCSMTSSASPRARSARSSTASTSWRPDGIEVGRRLVEHQHGGPEREEAGDREPLLLAAGERRRIAPLEAGEPDGGERRGDRAPACRAGGTPVCSRPNTTSCVTSVEKSWASKSWKTMPMMPGELADAALDDRRAARGGRRRSRPPRVKHGTDARRHRASVDLPAPVAPMTSVTVPGGQRQGDAVERRPLRVRVATA